MKRVFPLFLLLTACTAETDPMPYLNSTQRACLAQVKTAVRLKEGEQAMLFVDKEGRFSGAVTQNGFTNYALESKPYDACMAQADDQQANSGRAEVAPGVLLNPAEKALWDGLTPAQRQRALAFIANGATIQASLGDV